MTQKLLISVATIMMAIACQSAAEAKPATQQQTEAEIASCVRTVMDLEMGRWNYMGTIAQVRGTFRTYEAILVNTKTGPDSWSSKAFGGNVGGDEASAEASHTKLVGTSIFSVEDGKIVQAGEHKIKSCVGPDPEGRYEIHQEYNIPTGDDTFVTSKNMTWYSEHGSYYAEDIYTQDGRINSRRSGVYTPVKPVETTD